ncbi:hypothetical protein [Bradyrhizobium sp. 147]|uniref:hypothetical protein n=1 Tax=Bradyrhizobium sp. 147 TaxID=2782623 RepID=UPI001FF73654|nr:hypothetical protein [Bradyrhizobium sp. 147]
MAIGRAFLGLSAIRIRFAVGAALTAPIAIANIATRAIGFALGGMMPTFVSLVSASPAQIPLSLAYFAVGVFVIYLIGAIVIPETKGNFR